LDKETSTIFDHQDPELLREKEVTSSSNQGSCKAVIEEGDVESDRLGYVS
jgi:hypothetical protein